MFRARLSATSLDTASVPDLVPHSKALHGAPGVARATFAAIVACKTALEHRGSATAHVHAQHARVQASKWLRTVQRCEEDPTPDAAGAVSAGAVMLLALGQTEQLCVVIDWLLACAVRYSAAEAFSTGTLLTPTLLAALQQWPPQAASRVQFETKLSQLVVRAITADDCLPAGAHLLLSCAGSLDSGVAQHFFWSTLGGMACVCRHDPSAGLTGLLACVPSICIAAWSVRHAPAAIRDQAIAALLCNGPEPVIQRLCDAWAAKLITETTAVGKRPSWRAWHAARYDGQQPEPEWACSLQAIATAARMAASSGGPPAIMGSSWVRLLLALAAALPAMPAGHATQHDVLAACQATGQQPHLREHAAALGIAPSVWSWLSGDATLPERSAPPPQLDSMAERLEQCLALPGCWSSASAIEAQGWRAWERMSTLSSVRQAARVDELERTYLNVGQRASAHAGGSSGQQAYLASASKLLWHGDIPACMSTRRLLRIWLTLDAQDLAHTAAPSGNSRRKPACSSAWWTHSSAADAATHSYSDLLLRVAQPSPGTLKRRNYRHRRRRSSASSDDSTDRLQRDIARIHQIQEGASAAVVREFRPAVKIGQAAVPARLPMAASSPASSASVASFGLGDAGAGSDALLARFAEADQQPTRASLAVAAIGQSLSQAAQSLRTRPVPTKQLSGEYHAKMWEVMRNRPAETARARIASFGSGAGFTLSSSGMPAEPSLEDRLARDAALRAEIARPASPSLPLNDRWRAAHAEWQARQQRSHARLPQPTLSAREHRPARGLQASGRKALLRT